MVWNRRLSDHIIICMAYLSICALEMVVKLLMIYLCVFSARNGYGESIHRKWIRCMYLVQFIFHLCAVGYY